MTTPTATPALALLTATLLFTAAAPGPAAADEPASYDLAAAVAEAVAAGRSELKVPPGVYRMDAPVVLRKVRGFTLDGTGVTLIRTQPANVFTLNACDDITVRGFTIDYDPLPFTQGTVTAVDDQGTFDFEVHAGYPDLGPQTRYHVAYIFDGRTRLWKQGVADLYGRLEVLDARRGRFDPGVATGAPVEVGDRVSINPRRSNTFWLGEGSSRITLEGIRVWSCPGAAILGRFAGEGHVIRNLTIERGPRPAGATEDRLMSTNADAVNYGISRSALRMEDCDLGFMGDDALNIHGPVFPVVKVESATSVLVVRPWGRQKFHLVMRGGEQLRVLAPGTFAPLGRAVFASIEPVADHGLERAYLFRFLPPFKARKPDAPHTVYRVTLAEPVTLEVGQSLDHPASLGSGFVVRGNHFHDNRPRGLRLQASDGLVEGNRFERIATAAITVGAEYGQWGEAGWSEGLVIRGNSFVDIGRGFVVNDTNKAPAAVSVFGSHAGPDEPFPQGHRGIVIEGNRFERVRPAAVYVYAAKDVVIRGNTVVGSGGEGMADAGRALGIGPRGVIDVHPGAAAVVEGNTIQP